MKKIIYLLLIIAALMITGCDKQEKLNVNSCEGCAFSFYTSEDSKTYGDKDKLKDFTYDYKELKTKSGDSQKMFFGHILEDGIIKRGFACGINNGKIFCIEGTRDGSKYEDNAKILKDIFGEDNCEENDYFIKCKDDILAATNRDGTANVGVTTDGMECNVISNGTMYCG